MCRAAPDEEVEKPVEGFRGKFRFVRGQQGRHLRQNQFDAKFRIFF